MRKRLLIVMVCGLWTFALSGENQNATEKTFPKSKAAVEKVLKALQSSVAGRLPSLEGFAQPSEHPLDRFQRGYYQCDIQVIPAGAGSKVRVNAKITAWYSDPTSGHSGYQTLASNGRIEADLLDQIADALGVIPQPVATEAPRALPTAPSHSAEAGISAPMPQIPNSGLHSSPPLSVDRNADSSLKAETDAAEKHEQELSAEAKGLEEILQNQAHPNNLVAVKKTGTPVVQTPNADSKILFPATAGDEFELLDVNSNWVHVRISGISRGWLRRSEVEMPKDFAGPEQPGTSSKNTSSNPDEFRVTNEQIAPFPADWEPLRGKIVKIVTVQKVKDSATETGAQAKLQFAKALFMQQYNEVAAAPGTEGIVIIFDSEDGGMIAVNLPTLKQWQAGSVSDELAWKQCFFDPPELSGAGQSQ